jgi:hypothetical protein
VWANCRAEFPAHFYIDFGGEQFPAEDENVLLPLSNFSIVGMRREVPLMFFCIVHSFCLVCLLVPTYQQMLIFNHVICFAQASSTFISGSGDQPINILSIRLNLNLNAQTLEQLRGSRQNSCLDFVEELLMEAKEYILSGSDIHSQDKIEEECARIKKKITNPEEAEQLAINTADYFNDAHRYVEFRTG